MITIKKNTDLEEIRRLLASLSKLKKFDAQKFCGVLKLNQSPLAIQKSMRGEWQHK